MLDFKKCNTCKIKKSLDNYYTITKNNLKLRSSCIDCAAIAYKKYREKNLDLLKNRSKNYYYSNRDHTLLRQKQYKKNNPHILKNSELIHAYGISLDEYNNLLIKQNSKCLICEQSEKAKHNITKEIKSLSVDHDHLTGKVRGLLCSACNHGIGHFRDDINLLNRAILYLSHKL